MSTRVVAVFLETAEHLCCTKISPAMGYSDGSLPLWKPVSETTSKMYNVSP